MIMNVLSQIVGFIGSLCLLLFGMNMLSNGIQKCARLPNANHDDRQHFSDLLHITDTLENLSDETCSLMHTVKKYVSTEGFNAVSIRAKEIENYVEQVRIFFEQVSVYFTIGLSQDEKLAGEAIEQKIDETKKELKRARDCIYTMLQSV